MTLELSDDDRSLLISFAGKELCRYVYRPSDVQLESPRPYLHPVRTLGGDLVSLYRPHDHVWHKGIAWSLPNVGPANFWGGPTFVKRAGYQQLPNDGSMRHRAFERVEAGDGTIRVVQSLDWVTEQGETWFTEQRGIQLSVDAAAAAWTLEFDTSFTNVSGSKIVLGSPTTEGRPNAGYGGLFWRGPRSFTGGRVHAPGGGEPMGARAPWLGFTGQHDGHGRFSTLVFVDAPDNPGHPTQWFVRAEPYACVCPAPFFSTKVTVRRGATLEYRYAIVIADGESEVDRLAAAGLARLSRRWH